MVGKKDRITVILDVDGVLYDFIGQYREIQSRLGQPVTMSQYWGDYRDPDVWADLRLNTSQLALQRRTLGTVQSWDFIWGLNESPHFELVFVTARDLPGSRLATVSFLGQKGILSPLILFSPHKHLAASLLQADFLVEDNLSNAVATAVHCPDCTVFLISQPWNQVDDKMFDLPNLFRVESIDVAASYIWGRRPK